MPATIQYIRNYQTSIEYTSDELLLKYDNDSRERTLIRRELYRGTKNEGERQLVCAICNQPLRLCGGKGFAKQKLHFESRQLNPNLCQQLLHLIVLKNHVFSFFYFYFN